jgi:Rrf2 family transcriptional regulator, nitric oxide-sensitive transcriptional repressor
MQLTSYTDYSFRVLLYLSRTPNKFSTITEISEFYEISKNHLVKVVHSLARLGFIISIRGKGGGIKLAKSPSEISIGEVIRKMEPNFCLTECFNLETNRCVITNMCHLKGILNQGMEAFFKVLDGYSLADGSKNSLVKQIANYLNEEKI